MAAFNGILIIDKPRGMTSHDVVAKVRRHLKMKRVGHAGTLDPDATGLLLICLGNATKVSAYLMDGEKTYLVGFALGKVTDTYDSTGKVVEEHAVDTSEAQLKDQLLGFHGEQMQVPPPFSAVKIGGRKLYEYARKNQEVEVPSRKIVVKEFLLQRYNCPEGQAKIICSKGTYVRSLVHDLGKNLGVGGFTTSIRRIQSGEMTVEQGVTLEEFLQGDSSVEKIQTQILPISEAVTTLPQFRVIDAGAIERLRHGVPLTPSEVCQGTWVSRPGEPEASVLVVDETREAIALATLTPDLSLRVSRVI